MRYFIGYEIGGEAAKWHQGLAKDISDKFHTWKIYEKYPPHITLFRPFESEEIEPIKTLLEKWAEKIKGGNFVISDFGHFDDKVVFANVEADSRVREAVGELRDELKNFPGMPKEDFPVWQPHVTLANQLPPEIIRKIWEFVIELPKPKFILKFDNVCIFRHEKDGKWSSFARIDIAN